MPREAEEQEEQEEEEEEEKPESDLDLELELLGEPGAFDSSPPRVVTIAPTSMRGCIRRVNTASSSWWT